jgi:hypothetical protein
MESMSQLWAAPWAQPLLGFLLLVALLLLVWWRAGSFFSVLDHLWHLMAGRTDVSDPTLKQMLLTSRDLERFRFTYGIKAYSLADVRKVHAWCESHGMDVATLSKAAEWVDVDDPAMLKTRPRQVVGPCVMLFVELMLTGAFAFFLLFSGVLLSTKSTEVRFFLQEQSFTHWKGDWRVDAAACASGLDGVAKTTGFNSQEAAAVCQLLTDRSAKEFIDSSRELQTGMFWACAVLLLLMAYADARRIWAFAVARDLSKRIATRKTAPDAPWVEP